MCAVFRKVVACGPLESVGHGLCVGVDVRRTCWPAGLYAQPTPVGRAWGGPCCGTSAIRRGRGWRKSVCRGLVVAFWSGWEAFCPLVAPEALGCTATTLLRPSMMPLSPASSLRLWREATYRAWWAWAQGYGGLAASRRMCGVPEASGPMGLWPVSSRDGWALASAGHGPCAPWHGSTLLPFASWPTEISVVLTASASSAWMLLPRRVLAKF